MSDSHRYKIVQWMVWVQLALLPIVIAMTNLVGNGLMWRWNLTNNLMVGGYVLGLLALPVSRGLEKPKLLKWWLRIDFWCSLMAAIFAFPLLHDVGRHHILAEDGDYVLYFKRGGVMMVAPHFHLGEKDGMFIRELPQNVRLYDYGKVKIDCFRVDTLKGCCYGLNRGASPATWVLPIDSARYHSHAMEITALMDSLYKSQPLLTPQSCGAFVYPDNFVEVCYFGKQVSYIDSIYYDIEDQGDCIAVKFFKDVLIVPRLRFTNDPVGELSPKVIRTFIENLEKK